MKGSEPRRRSSVEALERNLERLKPILARPLAAVPDREVGIAEACIRLGISRTTLWRKQRAGELPRPITPKALARALGMADEV